MYDDGSALEAAWREIDEAASSQNVSHHDATGKVLDEVEGELPISLAQKAEASDSTALKPAEVNLDEAVNKVSYTPKLHFLLPLDRA